MNVRPLVRVLHVLPSMAFSAGMTSVVMSYHHAIDPEAVGFDYLYFSAPEDRVDEARELHARTWLLPLSSSLGAFRRVDAFFRRHAGEFDVVHCHPIFAPELMGRSARRYGAAGVIAHSHSSRFSDKPVSELRNRILSNFVGLCATDYFACSNSARALLGRHGDEAYLMRNAVDCARFSFDALARCSVRSRLGISPDTLLIGTLGRLEREKNQAFLLDVMRTLADRGVSCHLVVAGDGSLRDALAERACELGVEGIVTFTGGWDDAPGLYSALDVFVLPSLFEGLPVSGVEAQASGLPCIFSDTVTREVAFGACEFLPVGGAEAWARAIETVPKATSRSKGVAEARQAGFDIGVEAEMLARKYRSIAGR